MYNLLADLVLIAHALFIVFVLLGGLLLLHWPRLAWLHLLSIIWAVFAEVASWVCPLTPLENYWRMLAGGDMYQGDFIQRYLLPLVYPAGLTPMIQLMLAGVVVVLNLVIYGVVVLARRRAR